MNYTLNQLNIFLKVVQNESITKAAQELFLSQPAVSIQLKNFQDQFDIPLTQVVNRKLFVTDFGREVALTAEKILNEVNEMNFKTAIFKGKISGTLKVSVVSTGKYVIPYFLSDFLQKYPDIDLQLDVSNKSKITSDLINNTVDVSLLSTLPESLNVERISLMSNSLHLVSGRPMPNIKSIKNLPDDLPFIFREEGSATRKAMEDYVQKNGLSVNKKLVLTSNEAVKQAVMANIGISIMPIIGIRNELKTGQLFSLPLEGLPILSEWNLVWIKGKRMFPAAQAFVDYLMAEKQSIIQNHFAWADEYSAVQN
ncbi:MAG: LysR family transcriptional regulator [Flavobacteriia bacterium]|jgi:DNA-binding transcriptional LysR family regulator|nr:LysR family transcriptional regulator [Cryomorphaceae bacterium]